MLITRAAIEYDPVCSTSDRTKRRVIEPSMSPGSFRQAHVPALRRTPTSMLSSFILPTPQLHRSVAIAQQVEGLARPVSRSLGHG